MKEQENSDTFDREVSSKLELLRNVHDGDRKKILNALDKGIKKSEKYVEHFKAWSKTNGYHKRNYVRWNKYLELSKENLSLLLATKGLLATSY